MENKYLLTINKRKYSILIFLILFIIVAYIFYPRSVYSLIIARDLKVENITIIKMPVSSSEHKEVILLEENQKSTLKLLDSSYVRHKIFRKKSTSKNFMGYYIFVKYQNTGNDDTVYFFTTDIISVNGVQYKIYGKKFSEGFTSIFKEKITNNIN